MAITAETRTDIIELVVGMFDAAPGASVLSELAVAVDAGLSLKDLAITLGNSSVFSAEYPAFLTNTEFATNYLTNFMGGNPGAVSAANFTLAVDAVVALLNSGKSRGEVVYDVITAVSAVAETDTNFGPAAALLNNQTEVAEYYSVTTQQSGDTLDDLKAVVVNVTGDDASVVTAKASIDGSNNVGTKFSLTTGIDQFTGTTKNDTFTGATNGTSDTFAAGDILDGGAGTDTLNFIDTDGAGFNFSSVSISNIENVNITDAGTNAGDTYTVTSISGANITLKNADEAQTVTGLSKSSTFGLENHSDGALTLTYASVTGGSDATTINFNGSSGAAGTNVAAAGIETLTVNSTGAGSSMGTLTIVDAETLNFTADESFKAAVVTSSANLKTIAVSGDSAVTLTDLNTTATTALSTITLADSASLTISDALNAAVDKVTSTSSGKLNVTSAANTTAITGGSGDDTINIGTLVYSNNSFKLDGGAGTDTLKIGQATSAAFTTASKANISNFEALEQTAAGVTTDFEALSGITALTVSATGGTVDVDNLPSGTALTLTGAAPTSVDIAVKGVGAGGADTLNLTLAGATGSNGVDVGGAFIIPNIDTLNITSSGTLAAGQANSTTSLTAANASDLETVNILGSTALEFVTGAGSLDTIVASSFTGSTLTINAAGNGAVNVTGSAGKDTITGSSNDDTISAGAGDDTITGGTGADTMTGGDGADTYEFSTDGSVAGTALDKITDYASSSDKLGFGAAGVLLAAESNGTTATTDVDTSAGGKITFATADDTYAKKVTAIQADTELDAINSVAFFEDSGNTFVYYAGAATGNTDDQIIQLTGVTGLTTITLDAGDVVLS